MQEIKGDFWDIINNYNAICVTTNGIVKRDGSLVMGAGIAKDFRDRYKGLDLKFGALVKEHGNRAMRVKFEGTNIVSFPTKNNFKDSSDIYLITKSAKELVQMADKFGWKKVLLTQPGCGMGGLNWDYVKSKIGPIFDDRFEVVSK